MTSELAADKTAPPEQAVQTTQFFKTPAAPTGAVTPGAVLSAPAVPASTSDETISTVTLDGIPLPQFINTIYSTVLKRNVSVDPAILSRTDLVSLRTGKPQTAAQLSSAAQTVLKSYAVSINEFDGLVRAVPSAGVGGASVEIIRGRAQPDIPGSLRPVFYLVELDNTLQANVATWVRNLFQGRVTVTEDASRNALMLSGQSDSVSAAVEVIRTLDRPVMRGKFSARITPVFWSAAELSSRLIETLAAQGYSASANPSSNFPIIVLPVSATNSVIVFSVSESALNHALRWASQLDQVPLNGSSGRYITYYVRNTDAADVAKTLQEVLGAGGAPASPSNVAPASPAARGGGSTKVVVNATANSIILQTSPSEYQQIYRLLQELDRPARSALIMATVAEVTLSDEEQFGFNWLLSQFNSGGYIVNGGMGPKPVGGVTSASGIALNIASVAGDPRALLTALATSSRVRVLSNPSVVALSGQQATIQVGEDVPILTSQISNSSTGTNTGQGVLQTVQYRNVGIILKVKPVIRAGGRVDLEIGQEVSGVSTAATGLGNSPVVNTRRVDTRLTTLDGNTMLIGGLIREQRDGSNAGIPYLKDIPLVGGLFRTSGASKSTRTELVLLITPHVLEDDFDSRALTEAFRSQFAWGADLPVLTKETLKPLLSSEPAAVNGSANITSPSEIYKIPDAPTESLPPQVNLRQASRNDAATNPSTKAAVSDVQRVAPAGADKTAVPAVPGKLVTDERLRQELMDAIRGSKK